jgi:Putative transposase/Transposase zinc-binding domain
MECTLGSIFRQHFAGYAERHKQPLYIHRAAYWLAHCRTLDLGGHLNRCPEGHVEHASYNSCHQRYCPQCQGLATERWLQAQKARLLNCAHHHLIFTIPHELNELWMFNRAPMAQLLFGAVRDTLTELLADPKYLGARPAFMLALHTWGRSLVLHPHIHALVADGGLNETGTWAQPKRSHFLPARVVMMLFRGKFLAAIRRALESAKLRPPPNASRLTSLLNRTARVKWNVRLCTRYAHGAGVTAYLARYVRGGALKNSQIVHVGAEHISFRYRPHRDEDDPAGGPQLMRLTPAAFLLRYLAHVPPPGLQSLRAYGLYAHTQRKLLDQARERLGQLPVETPEPITPQAFLAGFANARPNTHCPRCGRALIAIALSTHATGPPILLH